MSKQKHLMSLQSKSRRGLSLIEMLLVIVLTAIVLGLVVTLLASLIDHQSATHQRAIQRSEVNRFTDILRSDMQQANSVESPDEKTLVLKLPSETSVTYTLESGHCRRLRETSDSSEIRRNEFRMGPLDTWHLEKPSNEGGHAATVTIKRPPAADTHFPAAPIRVVARLSQEQIQE